MNVPTYSAEADINKNLQILIDNNRYYKYQTPLEYLLYIEYNMECFRNFFLNN